MLVNPSARENVLLLGLVDWVPLERVHYEVSNAHKNATPSDVQTKTLRLIDTVVGEGLFVLGELAPKGVRFIPWDVPLDVAMQRLREVYVDGFDQPETWKWFCWLDLTDKGEQAALPLEQHLNSESKA